MPSERKRLVAKLDKAVSEYVRQRETECVICGSRERLTNGHLFSRVAYSTRWDTQADGNNHTQCWNCNYRHEFDPYPYFRWFISKFGQERFDQLHLRFVTPRKFKNHELEELYKTVSESIQI